MDYEKRTWLYLKNDFFWVGDSKNETLHIGLISDNQAGVRAFMGILHSLVNLPALYPSQYLSRSSAKVFPHYLIHVGDAVQSYDSLEEWQTEFADPLSYVWSSGQRNSPPPILYAHGNHDQDINSRYIYTTGERQGKNWFSTTLGAAHFVVLDSQPLAQAETQLDWLRRETHMEAWMQASFRIAIVHIAPFIEYWDPRAWEELGEKYWGKYVRMKLLPILMNSGVDLIVSGHQHIYSRGWMSNEVGKELIKDEFDISMNSSDKRQRVRVMANSLKQNRVLQGKDNLTYYIDHLRKGAMMTVIGGAGGELDSKQNKLCIHRQYNIISISNTENYHLRYQGSFSVILMAGNNKIDNNTNQINLVTGVLIDKPPSMATNSSYSGKVLICGSHACAKCGYCRGWYWSSSGKMKRYAKRPDATCTASYAYGLSGYGRGCRGCALCCLHNIPWVRCFACCCRGKYYGGAGYSHGTGLPLNGYLIGGVDYHIDKLAGVDFAARRNRAAAGSLVELAVGSGVGNMLRDAGNMTDGTLSKRLALHRDHHDFGHLCECSDNQQ
ncbi:unnamed protein product [Adineta steineri]|uniref:Calcineurin-like phosphoesterase domain-containing protein n=2 Tax=Adineta steineri TaxID=433720 RepID=A0A819UJG5_9BILA|nr:unnamed protein product [Adineta steineri]CAF4089632.1 unnamed protein product [Adineta steineri]